MADERACPPPAPAAAGVDGRREPAYDERVSHPEIAAAAATGLEARAGGEPRAPGRLALFLVAAAVAGAVGIALWPTQPEGDPGAAAADVAVIARGHEVAVVEHLVAGKFTLIDFYADWCPNCRRLNPRLEALARREPRLAIRKVNVISWDSPVARQYGLTALPHLLLYDPDGQLIAEGEAAWDALHRLSS